MMDWHWEGYFHCIILVGYFDMYQNKFWYLIWTLKQNIGVGTCLSNMDGQCYKNKEAQKCDVGH